MPLDPEPTIELMLETCVKLTTTEHTIALAVSKGVAEALSGLCKGDQRYFHCREPRHFIKDCPQYLVSDKLDLPYLNKPYQQRPNLQQPLGNSKRSAGQPRKMTPNVKPFCPTLPTIPEFGMP